MAAARSSLPLVLGGTLLFGALTFLLGMLVGVNIAPSAPPAASAKAQPLKPAAPAAEPAKAEPPSAPAQGGASSGAAEPAKDAPAKDAPTKSGAAEPAPEVKPVKVKGFGYGVPPSVEPATALRGKLLQQADAPAAEAQPGHKAAAPASKDSGGAPPLVYSVALGRFLMAENAVRLVAEAQAKGYAPVLVVPDPPDPAGWMTVTLGPQPDAGTAGRLASQAAAEGFETWLVSWAAP